MIKTRQMSLPMFVFIFFLILVLGAMLSYIRMDRIWKDEAVEKGHAEYYLDKDHNKKWRWKNGHDD